MNLRDILSLLGKRMPITRSPATLKSLKKNSITSVTFPLASE